MYQARKEQFSKSHSRKLSQILMKEEKFPGLKPICVTSEDYGIEKIMLGFDLKPLGTFSSLWTQTGP